MFPYVEATIQHSKWVKYGSLHLKKNVYLYLGSGSLHPIFGKVVGILVAGGHICVEENVTLCFDSHYHAFVTELRHASAFYPV